MSFFFRDFWNAARGMAKQPAFAAVSILLLALGIGANTAIFSLLRPILLRSLAVRDPATLVRIFATDTRDGSGSDNLSFPIFEEYRDQAAAFEGVAAYTDSRQLDFAPEGEPAREIRGGIVTGNYFQILGVEAALGRTILPSDDSPGNTDPAVMLSHGFWRRAFGGDTGVIGRAVRLNGHAFTVVGITPADFFGAGLNSIPDVWVSFSSAAVVEPVYQTQMHLVENPFFSAIGRLKPGISIRLAQAQMDAIAARMGAGQPIFLGPKHDFEWRKPWPRLAQAATVAGQTWRRISWLLTGVMMIVLLIACSSVSGLVLARAERRHKEVSIRLALGASRWQIARAFLAEGMLLAGLGAMGGVLLAHWALGLLLAVEPKRLGIPIGAASSTLDWRVLCLIVILTLVAGVGISLTPALRASRVDLLASLKSELQSSGRSWRVLPIRGGLLVLQVAAAAVLLTGTGLLLRTLWNAARVDTGFSPDRVLAADLHLSKHGYTKAAGQAFLARALQALGAAPVVKSVAASAGGMVTPDYFKTLGIPILRGRDFNAMDARGTVLVAIVNESYARKHWLGRDPIGERVEQFGPADETLEIVGLVTDAKTQGLLASAPESLYVPLAQFYQSYSWQMMPTIVVRADGEPAAVAPIVLATLTGLDRNLPALNVQSLRERMGAALTQQRFLVRLLEVFGGLALLVTCAGLYGLVAYTTQARTREIGVRMALGAQPADVARLVLSWGMKLIALGLVAGVAASLALGRVLSSMLFAVRANDPLTLAGVAFTLIAVAAAACYIPLRRATRIDPVAALRSE